MKQILNFKDLHRPIIIAELSCNHGGSLENAKTLIEQAKSTGVDAVKIQSYSPDSITVKKFTSEHQIQEGEHKGRYLYDIYNEAQTPLDWIEPLFKHALKMDIPIFSSPFDFTSISVLREQRAPAYKISSFDIVNLPLIESVSKLGKPIIVSCGMASVIEIQRAYETAKKYSPPGITLLYCISSYPAMTSQFDMTRIETLKSHFPEATIGLSDHAETNIPAIVAASNGAKVFEKHFKGDLGITTLDSKFSLTREQMKNYIDDVRAGFTLFNRSNRPIGEKSDQNKRYRPSLFFARQLNTGTEVTEADIVIRRPALGLPPDQLSSIIGKVVLKQALQFDPVSMSYFEDQEI